MRATVPDEWNGRRSSGDILERWRIRTYCYLGTAWREAANWVDLALLCSEGGPGGPESGPVSSSRSVRVSTRAPRDGAHIPSTRLRSSTAPASRRRRPIRSWRTLCFRSSSRRDTATSGYPFPRATRPSATRPDRPRRACATDLRGTIPERWRRRACSRLGSKLGVVGPGVNLPRVRMRRRF